jgi:hypothetical protein
MRQGDPLKGLLFVLAHYWALLETIMRPLSCVFPSLANDIHIMGPLSEITYAFDHCSTQSTFVGLRVKVSKCNLWIRDLSKHKIFIGLHFCHIWLTHFWCANGFLRLCHAFFGWNFIVGRGAYQWSSSHGRCLGCFGHFVLMCNLATFLFYMENTSFLLVSFGKFQW